MSAFKRTTGSTLLARKPANLLKKAAFKVPAYAFNRQGPWCAPSFSTAQTSI